MAKTFELSASQLASLDQVIAQRRSDPELANDWADAAHAFTDQVCVPMAAAVFAAAAIAGVNIVDKPIRELVSVARSLSLEELLEIRKNAITKR